MYSDQIDELVHTHHQNLNVAITNTNPSFSPATAMEMELHHHYNYNSLNPDIQLHLLDNHSNWHELPNFATTPTDNFLNILPFPAPPPPGFLASLGLLPPDGSSSSLYNSVLPPQPTLLRELFHSVPEGNGYGTMDGVFAEDLGKNWDGKHQNTEKHRRVLMTDKYQALRKLVPNPSKNDRASIVGDAIDYINELKTTVTKLKVLVEKKRCAKERLKRPKTEDGDSIEGNNDDLKSGSPIRTSWLHRKSKNTEVDVRIIDDEVTLKLVQQKGTNCLLFVSKVLDEFQLDLHHVAGGLIGDYYSFLFNTKISEGSIVYASAVANKVIEVVDKQCESILTLN